MATNYPPYMNAHGMITKILEKIKVAATPDRFTQDYLATELGFSGGSAKAFIPLAKRLGLLNSDGTPSNSYKQFRNQKTSKAAMASAIKKGYADVYTRNEYAHSLGKKELEGLLIEMTGTEHGNKTVQAVIGSFEALKGFAHFGKTLEPLVEKKSTTIEPSESSINKYSIPGDEELKLNLAYTINLVLPKTDDIAVFNAIFKSLKENLLKK